MKLKTIILERLESQVVEIVKLKTELEAQTARSTKLRNWWDEETEKTNRLETQAGEQDKRIQELEAKLEVADLAPELEPFAKAETRDEVS